MAKTIGLLGGMSWESTESYYRALNEGVKAQLGGLHSAKILLHSFDFADIEAQQVTANWKASAELLGSAAAGLEAVGADFIMICTNTMHKVADEVAERINIPLLHIADATAEVVKERGIKKVALLGSDYTMVQDFYKGRLKDKHNIETIIPDTADRKIIHDVIFDELCKGAIKEDSRAEYIRIIESLHSRGAEAVILGCTEIALLVGPEHTSVPLIDTTQTHADAAVKLALEG